MTKEVQVVNYQPRFAKAFKDLNIAWLRKYFYVEPIDEVMLSDPEGRILQKGGHIFFALVDGNAAGTCALLQQADGSFELGKMAVDPAFQGQGIGHLLMETAIHGARNAGAQKLILYSNSTLGPALHLYRKFGFREIPMGHTDYKRSNIKMEKELEL